MTLKWNLLQVLRAACQAGGSENYTGGAALISYNHFLQHTSYSRLRHSYLPRHLLIGIQFYCSGYPDKESSISIHKFVLVNTRKYYQNSNNVRRRFTIFWSLKDFRAILCYVWYGIISVTRSGAYEPPSASIRIESLHLDEKDERRTTPVQALTLERRIKQPRMSGQFITVNRAKSLPDHCYQANLLVKGRSVAA